jgi:hypothetical protein
MVRNTASQPATAISSNDIAARAYEIYVDRGGVHGHDLEDWLRAERELGAAPHFRQSPRGGATDDDPRKLRNHDNERRRLARMSKMD